MERPSTVTVGPLVYKIKYKDDLDPYRHLVGMSHHEDLEIWIKECHELKMKEILTHELIHCIIHVYAGGPSEDSDLRQEPTVLGLGFGWLQVLRDNAAVAIWLLREE